MIGFLKKKQEAMAAGDEDESTKRSGGDYGFVDAIADDMLEALNQKDKGLLREALQALCDYIREEDIEQDQMQ